MSLVLKAIQHRTLVSSQGQYTISLRIFNKAKNYFSIAEKSCENLDLTKSFLYEKMNITDLTDTSKYAMYKRYKYTFRWDPQPNQRCSESCKDLSSSFSKCECSRCQIRGTRLIRIGL
jgi:uncharacterized paraquat-inducible protein A